MSELAVGSITLALALMPARIALAASDYLEQMTPGDAIYELAAAMEARGCRMTEPEIFGFLAAQDVDAQSVIKDLAATGDLRWDQADSYTLRGWGKCR